MAKKIMIVDDEVAIVETLKLRLEANGFDYGRSFGCGYSAVQARFNSPRRYDAGNGWVCRFT